jgi:glycosyltransferase involved in cell wall biosynthesis
MKILLLSPMFPPQGSGAEISSMLECRDLVEHGLDVVLVTNNRVSITIDEEWFRKVRVYQIPMSFISFIYPFSNPFGEFSYWFLQKFTWKYVYNIAIKEKVDLIHIQHAYIGFKKEKGLPIVLTIRDYWPICSYRTLFSDKEECCAFRSFIAGFPCRRKTYLEYGLARVPHLAYNMYFTPLLNILNRKLYSMISTAFQEVDQFIAISYFLKKTICKNLNISSKKVEVIYPPLPNLPYVPRENNSSKITFTYIGALEAHKGVKNLLRAFHIAINRNREIMLLLCGSGGLKKWLKNYIRSANLEKYVNVIGKVDPVKLYDIYQRTDVVVVPSLWFEPFGRVVIEALCAGRPVVVNPIGGLREQIIDGFNGFYVNCYDIYELAKGVLNISKMPKQELLQMGLKAREDILKRFCSENRVYKLLRIYNSVI